MRVMVDTNIIVSAALFPKSGLAQLFEILASKHMLVICSHVVEELQIIFKKKFPEMTDAFEEFLVKLTYEYFYTPQYIEISKYPSIRDKEDLPILVSSILADVDVLITGDKDFSKVEIDKPEILTPRELMDIYG